MSDPPGHPDPLDEDVEVGLLGQVTGIDGRRGDRVVRPEGDPAATLRPELCHADGEAVALLGVVEPVSHEVRRGEVELQVRGVEPSGPRFGPREPTRFGDVRRERPPLEQEVLRVVPERLGVVERHGFGRAVDVEREQVVLEVPPDARQVRPGLDAVFGEVVGVADTGEHQQLRGVDGSRTDDDLPVGTGAVLPAVLPERHAGRPVPVERDPGDVCTGLGPEVRPVERGREERVRRATALPVLLCEVVEPDPLLPLAVEVGIAGVAGGDRCVDEPTGESARRTRLGDVQRPAHPVVLRPARLEVLALPEVREQLLVAPSLVSEVGPVIVVGGVSPDVDHRVDRGGAAEGLPPGPVEPPPRALGLWFGVVLPVGRAPHQFAERQRDVDLAPVVRLARLEDQDRAVRALGEPVGHHTARRARPDHHVVVRADRPLHLPRMHGHGI